MIDESRGVVAWASFFFQPLTNFYMRRRFYYSCRKEAQMRLTKSEWQIMNALWERYPATAREVEERVCAALGCPLTDHLAMPQEVT